MTKCTCMADWGKMEPTCSDYKLCRGVTVTDDMVARALQGFDCGTGDPNDYKRRMRLALEAALQPLT